MLPSIVQTGHLVLRRPAADVSADLFGSAELASLVKTMVEVMRKAPGVGLAAPQIGVGLRVAVLEDAPDYMAKLTDEELAERGRAPLPLTVLVNPTITRKSAASVTFYEGCLSVSGYMAMVERALEVDVRAFDEKGAPIELTLRGWAARIAQHEVDHLGGMLYVDRMLTRSFSTNDEMRAHWMRLSIADARAALGLDGPLKG